MNESPLFRCLQTVELTMHASVVCLERFNESLTRVAVAAARESDRVQSLADSLPVLPDGGPLAGPLGLATAGNSLADVRTAFMVHRESLDLIADHVMTEADRIDQITSELLSILPPAKPVQTVAELTEPWQEVEVPAGMPCPICRTPCEKIAEHGYRCPQCAPVAADPPASPEPVEAPPAEPTTPPITVPAPEPNPAPSTPAAEETVVVAANSATLAAPTTPLKPAWMASHSPDDNKAAEEMINDIWGTGQAPADWSEEIDPPCVPSYVGGTDDGPPDTDDEEDEDDDNEGTDLHKLTTPELAQEVFGEVPSASDEARARVLERFPDARIVERGNGQRSGTKYIVYTGQGRQSRPVSTRRSSEQGAWIDAAATLS